MRLHTWLVPALALAAGGCTDVTRSIGDIAFPGKAPPLYPIERELQQGNLPAGPSTPRTATARVALVVGNQDYKAVTPLDNPVGDAKAVADLLRSTGHRVVEAHDLTKRQFEKALRDLAIEAGSGNEILVFFAGHGFQVANEDYLLPVDARLSTQEDLPFQAVRVDTLFRLIGARSQRHISLLDSCRNNPFPEAQLRVSLDRSVVSPEQGFTEPEFPGEGLVAYSTAPGDLAFDGSGEPHSPFAASLINRARSDPGSDLTQILARVQQDVRQVTRGEQIPTWVSKLRDPLPLAVVDRSPAKISVALASGQVPAVAAAKTVANAPASTTSSVLPAEIRIEAPRERTVAIGSRLLTALGLGDAATVTLSGGGAHGSLATATAGGEFLDRKEVDFTTDDGGAVFYRLGPDQIAVGGTFGQTPVVEENMTALIQPPGAPQTRVSVTFALVPDRCDLEGGEWFDLQGVGVYRTGGRFQAERAIAVCRASVATYPDHGRFRFQLGRALMLAEEYEEAETELRRAANLGHIRAWHRLGLLYQEQGRTGPAKQAFEKGLATWDPASAMGLGELLLQGTLTPARKERAWDLLTYASDYGMCEAMTSVAKYVGRADEGGSWGQRFETEAELRLEAARGRGVACKLDPEPSTGFKLREIEGGGEGGSGY